MSKTILGIETSCDETAAAVVQDGRRVLANVVASQIELHRPYGGVVPELASRNHLRAIRPVIDQALAEAGVTVAQLDAVAVTSGPGLASSLLIGLNAASGLALAAGLPLLPINHLEAHLYSPLLGNPPEPPFPVIALIVSGGHTILAKATAVGHHRVLGQTVDDAAGEAFDKVAKLLGLAYPGGPEIDRFAGQGDPAAIAFPRSMLREPGFDFSFSGLKTAVMYYLRQHPFAGNHPQQPTRADVAASFQEAVVDVLVGKLIRAATAHRVATVSVSGGVSLNSRLRSRLEVACREQRLQLLLAPAAFCADNAAMIAALAFHKLADSDPGLPRPVNIAPSCGLAVAA